MRKQKLALLQPFGIGLNPPLTVYRARDGFAILTDCYGMWDELLSGIIPQDFFTYDYEKTGV